MQCYIKKNWTTKYDICLKYLLIIFGKHMLHSFKNFSINISNKNFFLNILFLKLNFKYLIFKRAVSY